MSTSVYSNREQIAWPKRCVCCGGEAETTTTLIGTQSVKGRRRTMHKYSMPICRRCKHHKEVLSQPPEANVLVLLAAVFTFGLAFIPFYFYRQSSIAAAHKVVGPDCCSDPVAPVRYRTNKFTFANDAYGTDFRDANRGPTGERAAAAR